MAAEMAVESTAQEMETTVQEGRSVRAEIAQEDHLEKAQKEEALAETVQEEHLERTLSVQEDRSVKVLREEASAATDKTLWQAAYKAALGAHFNMDANAPALQEGTITYIFRMR